MADQEWIKNHSQHLEKLKDWLNTKVEIVEMDTDETGRFMNISYTGDILELIGRLNGMLLWICSFIKKIQRGDKINSVDGLIYETVLPYDEVYIISPEGINEGTRVDTYKLGKKLDMYVHTMTAYKNTTQAGFYFTNLKTLCEKIMQLNKDQLEALHDMLCLENDKGQSLYNWSAWSELVKQNRAKQGHVMFYERPDRKPEDSVGGPWVEHKGGKRTKRHKRSSKRSSKRSGHKRSGHKRSDKRSNKSRRR